MLTPVDIENKEFAKVFRGYDSIEVDEFMRSLVSDYEKLYRENGSLKEKNALLSETLENYKGMESTMQNAILVAQKTAEDIKQNAYDRSSTITKEADIKAENIIAEAEKRVAELEKEYSGLKKEMNTFKARMNSLLQTYLRLLEDIPSASTHGSLPKDEGYSDLERDIDKIQKQHQFKNDVSDITLKEQPKIEADASETAEEEEKVAQAEGDSEKNEAAPEAEPENTYTPKRVNPLVEELLKKRASGEGLDSDSLDADADKKPSGGVPDEIVINLSKDTTHKPYDVFSDDSL